MPRYKSLLRWEPFPYLLLLVVLLLTGFVRPSSPPWLLWPLVLGIAACLAWIAVKVAQERRPANPDQWGNLSSLADLRLVDAPGAEREVRAVVHVEDAQRHQAAIELARIHGGPDQHAVLVPRASRWLSMRYRIGVELVGGAERGDRPRHAGFLRHDAEERWGALLDTRGAAGEYLRVPARITGESRPFGVELDLSGAEALEPGDAA
ncbi:hypothetical protein ACDF64_12135 [Agromyces sp. MMS24-JH15]|uniref:hypothetical protein n=1 Tax=Agromyces sp. MMS24-JH15 TaxID=3243765 RepID=UPI003749CC6C